MPGLASASASPVLLGNALEADPATRDRALAGGMGLLALAGYALLGAALGVVFVRSQVISWFRIFEMFRFESFHMYGVIGSTVATAALSLWAIRRLDVRTIRGEPIRVAPKAWGPRA